MQVIKGGKLIKEEQYKEKRKQLKNIFERCFYENYYLLEDKKKACYYGLRFFNLNDANTKTSLIDIRNMIMHGYFVIDLLEDLTYEEFFNMFPISKYYDFKNKYEMKTYISVKEVVNKYDKKAKIGKNIHELLQEYDNPYTNAFICKLMAMTDLYNIKQYGATSMLENFFNMVGVQPTIIVKDENTGKFFNKETGEEVEISKAKPKSYIKNNFSIVD